MSEPKDEIAYLSKKYRELDEKRERKEELTYEF